MKKVLKQDFFDRPTLLVARDLIGKYLVRTVNGREVALMITETEAYDGHRDRASHASRGQTPRNTPMFGRPGTIYVYFTYGMHWMLNVVTGKTGYPAAVLIRGAVIISHVRKNDSPVILNGPAKLTKFLRIDKRLNGKKLSRASGLWVEDRGVRVKSSQIKRTPRIGVTYAGSYAKKPWRFVLKS